MTFFGGWDVQTAGREILDKYLNRCCRLMLTGGFLLNKQYWGGKL
jgi:hypothetical protein